MRAYRQHVIVLVRPLAICALLVLAGLALWALGARLAGAATVLCAALLGLWRLARWWAFTIYVEGRQVAIRSLSYFVTHERLLSLNAPGGVRLRQNLAGYMLDYGTLQISIFGESVNIKYIAGFSRLRRQVDGL